MSQTDTALSLQTGGMFPSLAGGLAGYARMVKGMPFLSAQEERASAIAYRDHGDADAGRMLVLSHLRLSLAVARNYRNYGLPEEDLVQEGNIGLLKALNRYDPDKGARFGVFALYWIKAEIQEFVIRNWRIVRVATTKAQRKLFFNLRRKLKDYADRRLTREDTRKIAEELDVRPEDVDTMRHRMTAPDIPFETLDPGDDEEGRSPAHLMGDSTDIEQETVDRDETERRLGLLREAIATLDERSRDILVSRQLAEEGEKAPTLQELAGRYRVSAERVRQIEARAMKSIKKHMIAAGA